MLQPLRLHRVQYQVLIAITAGRALNNKGIKKKKYIEILSCLFFYLNTSFSQPLIRCELKISQKPWNMIKMDGMGCSVFNAADFVHEFLVELKGGLN